MKKEYRLFPYLNFILTCLLLILFIQSICLAENLNFTFAWDANHPNDNVIEYRIYWSTTSNNYKQADSEGILIGDLDDQNNPRWKLTISGTDPTRIYYFVATAEDNRGLESDYSNEVGGVGTIGLNVPPSTDGTCFMGVVGIEE